MGDESDEMAIMDLTEKFLSTPVLSWASRFFKSYDAEAARSSQVVVCHLVPTSIVSPTLHTVVGISMDKNY